jgi:small subunit ribosomal protein S20
MPIIKSAKKALRQSQKRKIRNTVYKQKMKSLLKETRALFGQEKADEAKKNLSKIYKALDKAAKEGIIKKNTASRKKSRITKFLSKPAAKAKKK